MQIAPVSMTNQYRTNRSNFGKEKFSNVSVNNQSSLNFKANPELVANLEKDATKVMAVATKNGETKIVSQMQELLKGIKTKEFQNDKLIESLSMVRKYAFKLRIALSYSTDHFNMNLVPEIIAKNQQKYQQYNEATRKLLKLDIYDLGPESYIKNAIQLINNEGANINAVDKYGRNIAHTYVGYNNGCSCEHHYINSSELENLFALGLDPNAKAEIGYRRDDGLIIVNQNYLQYMLEEHEDDPEGVRVLAKHVKINEIDALGDTSLDISKNKHRYYSSKLLRELGAEETYPPIEPIKILNPSEGTIRGGYSKLYHISPNWHVCDDHWCHGGKQDVEGAIKCLEVDPKSLSEHQIWILRTLGYIE